MQVCEGSLCPSSPQSQCLSWQQVALQALEDQQALKRGPLRQAEGKENTKHTSKGGLGTDAHGQTFCHFQAGPQLQD